MIDGGKGSGWWAGGAEGASEPRRLIDEVAADPSSALSSPKGWAVELLRTVGPYRAPAGRKQRVRLGLGQAGARGAPLVLRPAIAAAVLVGCGAAASAALGHWPALVARAYRQIVSSSPPAAPPPVEVRPRHASGRSLALPVPVPVITPPLPPPESAPAPARTPSSPAPSHPTATVSRARRAAPVVATTDDTSPVLEAMRALRLEGNPVRARALLAKYLDRHPGGTLAEEALALSIEAAVADHDADAVMLARRYLARYPAGHFSALARQTLGGNASGARP